MCVSRGYEKKRQQQHKKTYDSNAKLTTIRCATLVTSLTSK